MIDTHVHLWDPARLGYAWHRHVPALARPFLLEDFDDATRQAALEVEAFVFIECDCDATQRHDEVAMVTELAQREPRLRGIVAQAPLEAGERVRDDLEALASNPLVKGVRRITQAEPDPEFCNTPAFVAGTRMLAEFGLSCDLCITHRQLEPTTRLVRACPEVRFILDHLAKPDIRGGAREPWATHLRELAKLPNVWCKLSGVVTEAAPTGWTDEDLAFYMRHALDCFGPERLIFGSDWPVVNLAADYRRWLECVLRLLAPLSATDQQRILHGNAVTFCRLENCS